VLATIRAGLAAKLPSSVVDKMLDAYQEAKRNFYLGGNRLSEVEGGRFCEAALRLLQHRTTGTFTPLGTQLDAEAVTRSLSQLRKGTHPDSVRLYIPQALRVVYDIRNTRDAAHLGDGIDPNLQDASVVVNVLDWVMAEFVRLYHGVTPDQAQKIVDGLVTRQAPAVQDFAGHLKVLRADLGASEHTMVLLYQCGDTGASVDQLATWSPESMRTNLRRTLKTLCESKRFVHDDGTRFVITRSGQLHVERKRLLDP
jgi:hypothetical protein